MGKLKTAIYWAAACGGCDIAIVEIGAHLLELDAAAQIVLWPAAMDFKYNEVEALPDGDIDLCLYNGAVRTSEQEHIAKLLRRKSKVMVAFGSCAHEGCIPGLANLKERDAIMRRAYAETPSTANPDGIMPQTATQVPEGEVPLPAFWDKVDTLAQTVPVDYFVPGCPPSSHQVWKVLQAVIAGQLPERGSVVGVYPKTVCDQCGRVRLGTKVKHFYRPHEIIPDPERCFLEQGLICAGPATRAGCNEEGKQPLCIAANMPCRGCYGPPDGVPDQGAKLLSAIASIVEGENEHDMQAVLHDIVDPVGIFYRFSLSDSLLRQVMEEGKRE